MTDTTLFPEAEWGMCLTADHFLLLLDNLYNDLQRLLPSFGEYFPYHCINGNQSLTNVAFFVINAYCALGSFGKTFDRIRIPIVNV